jgi:hypothetical protein
MGAVVILLVFMTIGPNVPTIAAQVQPECQTFKETNKTLCGQFLAYWNAHGGIAQQGFPITNEFLEVSDTDGKIYTVQYFERAVFELHPENKPPYDVLLSHLGKMLYKQKYPNGAQELPPDARSQAGLLFPETGKEIRGLFLDYWKSHGGLAQFGFPITNLVREKSDLDGKEYIMQYFERAVFELHPENKPPYDVLLSQLGTLQFKKKYLNGPTLPASQWGGEGITLQIIDKGARLEYHCAYGRIDTPSITLDDNGHFDVQGVHTFIDPNSERPTAPQAARYTGMVKGDIMTLTVTVSNASVLRPKASGHQVLGPFTLILNQPPVIHRCQ